MDLTQLSAEDLIADAYKIREEFQALHDSEDMSDDTLDQMAEYVDRLEALQSEADRRVALAVKREELAAKVSNLAK